MTSTARSSPPWRRCRPAPAALILALACACLARTAAAADPTGVDAGSAERAAGATDRARDAGTTDHGTVDHDATAPGARAGAGPDGEARGPANASAALARTSASGLYRVELRDLPDPVPLNRMHEWIVHVETGAGVPVTGASIAMDGGMPAHDHGLPTAPRVTEELGAGDYLLEGVRFQMGGHWIVEFSIDAAPGEDSVSFDLSL